MIDDKDYEAVMAVSNEKFDKAVAEIREEQAGPTNQFPLGKIGPDDKGELSMGIDLDLHGNVRLEFGTPVTWLAMPPEQAAGLGRLLIRMASVALRAKRGGPPARPMVDGPLRPPEPLVRSRVPPSAFGRQTMDSDYQREEGDGEPAGEAGTDAARPARE